MTQTMAIRPASAGDARAIAEVHVEGWRWAYRGLLPDAVLDGLSRDRREAMWREALATAGEVRLWLAERDGQAIGFVATAPARDPDAPPSAAEVTAIYLARGAAGTGVGRELLQRATDDLRDRGFASARLWVFAANLRARRFYEIAGWRPDGAIQGVHLGDAERSELRYTRSLDAGGPPVVELRSQRLVLRAWRDDDLTPFAALNADPRVMEFFPSRSSRADSDAMVERIRRHFAHHGFGLWAIEVPGAAGFVGFVGLVYVSFAARFTPAIEVGWRLAAEHWGHGYASEAARAAVDFGFGRLQLDEIVSMTVPSNARSRGVMEKLGMQRSPADDFDHPKIAEGHPLRRHVLYRLTRTAWADPRAGAADAR